MEKNSLKLQKLLARNSPTRTWQTETPGAPELTTRNYPKFGVFGDEALQLIRSKWNTSSPLQLPSVSNSAVLPRIYECFRCAVFWRKDCDSNSQMMKVHPPCIPAALFWYMMSNHTWGAASRDGMLKATCVAQTKSLQICLASMLQGRRFWEMCGKSEQGVAKIAPKRALLQQCDVSPWYIHSYLIWIVSHSVLFRNPGIQEIETFWHEVSTNYMVYGYGDFTGVRRSMWSLRITGATLDPRSLPFIRQRSHGTWNHYIENFEPWC